MVLVVIFLAGGLGSVCRYLLSRLVQSPAQAFPTGTLVVNVLGCIAIGVIARYFLDDPVNQVVRTALIVGFCGGFTTFSAFSFETVGLVSDGRWAHAAGYVAASLVLCIGGTALGFALGPTQKVLIP